MGKAWTPDLEIWSSRCQPLNHTHLHLQEWSQTFPSNENDLFHLISNQNFPEFGLNGRHPTAHPAGSTHSTRGNKKNSQLLPQAKGSTFFMYSCSLMLTQLEGWPFFKGQLFSINTGTIVNEKFVIYIPTWTTNIPTYFSYFRCNYPPNPPRELAEVSPGIRLQ